MAKRNSLWARPILFVCTVTVVLAGLSCEKRQSEDGGQDTGGGFVAYSKPEEVNAALDKAIELATEPITTKNIIAQFWWYWGRKTQFSFITQPAHVFPKLVGAAIDEVDLKKDSALFESPALMALKTNRITRLSTGKPSGNSGD